MPEFKRFSISRLNRLARLLVQRSLVVLLLATVQSQVFAAIEYSQAQLLPENQGFVLQADAAIELNPSIESGLASGVPLYFNATFTIVKDRRWWFDSTLYQQVFRYSLVYYELTRHYRVSWLHDSRSRNFRSLLDALDSIATMPPTPIDFDQSLLAGENYKATINLALDQNALPLALRPLAFVNTGWRLHSEEYQWQIN